MITSFAPNNGWKDVLNSLGYIFLPWRWLNWRSGRYQIAVANKLKEILEAQEGEFFTFDSGRTALHQTLQAFGIGEGDEVIIQAFTCVVVPNALLYAGATPVYVDIEEDSYNMNPADIENKITSKTKAIIVQHTFGFAANLPAILEIANKHDLVVIEDCAHSLGAEYNSQKLGVLAHAAIFSFGADKVVSSVRGGAAYINDLTAINNLHHNKLPHLPFGVILKHLLYPSCFALGKLLYPIYIGKVWLYLCKKMGITARIIEESEKRGIKPSWFPAQMPNCLAHLAYVQLKNLRKKNEHRQAIATHYRQKLPDAFLRPHILEQSFPIYLRYPLQIEARDELIAKAKNSGIFLGDWYDTVVAPKDVEIKVVRYTPGSCPVAEKVCRKVFNLPTHQGIDLKKAQKIIDLLK